MKNLILLLGTLLFSACDKYYPNLCDHYLKEQFIIMRKEMESLPMLPNISDTTEYTELSGYNWSALANYHGSKLYYSKNIGDTLFFE